MNNNLKCFKCHAVTPVNQKPEFRLCAVCSSLNVKPTRDPVRYPAWYRGGRSQPVMLKRRAYARSKRVG